MKPRAWLAIGSGVAVATGVVLLARKSTGGGAPPESAPPTYGEVVRVLLPVPSSWRRTTGAEVAALPELGARANTLLSDPNFASISYGTLTPFVASDGKTYATWIEQHYHAPGGPVQPWGFHRGVTLLAKTGGPGSLLDEWRSVEFW